ncbi:hypothetical protein [Streptomyces sp. L2]|uniref:hypothetical protein n=1 Tax=Streptomyces sp. L2 TaxID=2162665 RepID=UPI001010A42E|nr:hypothetical protein [Streptomyces sp. L2]
MDLDAVADELYGVRPEDFVAARDRRAAEARDAGEPDLAKEIGTLRRPSLAAWVSNLLVRRQADEVRPLLTLGEDLRRAHRELDGPQLRRLAHQQREVIGTLGRQARQLAAQAGHPVGEGVQREVEETLHAALADPGAAREWAAGRLVKPLSSTVGFPAADESAVGRRRTAPPAPAPEGTAKRSGGGEERRRTAEQRRRLTEARRAARDAERELRARQDEAASADREAEDAARRLTEAEERLRDLREQTRRAQEEQRRARAGDQSARERAREADRAVREARRRAESAARAEERTAAAAG